MEVLKAYQACQDLSPIIEQVGSSPKHRRPPGAGGYKKRLRAAMRVIVRADAHLHALRTREEAREEAARVLEGELPLEALPGGAFYETEDCYVWTMPVKMPKEEEEERMTPAAAIELMRALRLLHGHRLMERDVKPDRIVVNLEENLDLADFGTTARRT